MAFDANEIVRRVDRAFRGEERQNAEFIWTELAEFLIPNQSRIFQTDFETPGAKKTRRMFDAMPISINHDLATAIHSTLTNPATKWSHIRYEDEELNNIDEAVEWLEAANNMIHKHLNESNFDSQLAAAYQLFTSLGTMAILHEEVRVDGEFTGFKFTALHMAEIAVDENADKVVDVLYRKFRLTAKQAVELFGDEVSDAVSKANDTQPSKLFKFLHYIYPRDPKEVELNEQGLGPPDKRPFVSIYVEHSARNIVREEGFYEFPGYVPRWGTMPTEKYGRGPGHNALPDVRTLNELRMHLLHSSAMAARTPWAATMRNILGALDMRPGALTVVRDINGLRPLDSTARFDVSQATVQDLHNSIKQAFFIDKLMLPPRDETGEMTAFEVQKRLEQMQRVLGPTISRFGSEFLQPLVLRSFKILLREQVLPPLPDVVREKGLLVDIVFLNQLSRAQQMDSINNIQQWVEDVAGLAQLDPSVVDNVDADGIARHIARVRGVPEAAIKNIDEVAALREARAEQQQQQALLEQGVQAADIASKL